MVDILPPLRIFTSSCVGVAYAIDDGVVTSKRIFIIHARVVKLVSSKHLVSVALKLSTKESSS